MRLFDHVNFRMVGLQGMQALDRTDAQSGSEWNYAPRVSAYATGSAGAGIPARGAGRGQISQVLIACSENFANNTPRSACLLPPVQQHDPSQHEPVPW
jgi:hypothetical protein